MCMGCLDEIENRSKQNKNSNMTYLVTDMEYSTGECCFKNCGTEDSLANSNQVSDLGKIKYFLCPIDNNDYQKCGLLNGESNVKQTIHNPKNDGL